MKCPLLPQPKLHSALPSLVSRSSQRSRLKPAWSTSHDRSDPPWAGFLFETSSQTTPERPLKDILDSKINEACNSYVVVQEQQQQQQQEAQGEVAEDVQPHVPCKACQGRKKVAWWVHIIEGMKA